MYELWNLQESYNLLIQLNHELVLVCLTPQVIFSYDECSIFVVPGIFIIFDKLHIPIISQTNGLKRLCYCTLEEPRVSFKRNVVYDIN